jgi:hypothetical protein
VEEVLAPPEAAVGDGVGAESPAVV